MSLAARVGDLTDHPGIITGPGVKSVSIAGLPAAVVGNEHACYFPPPSPHPATTIVKGSSSVFIGGCNAARKGDRVGCGATIITGAFNVRIGGL